MSASGLLVEVFEISGRGSVVVLEDFKGSAKVGDLLVLGASKHKIAGLEMVSFRDVGAAERNLRLRRFSFSVSGCSKQLLETYKGARLQIETGST